jgi:hypothetical protein
MLVRATLYVRQGTYCETETFNAFTGDTQCKNQVAENPNQHQVGTESLIAIVHAWFIIIFRLHIWLQRSLHRRFKLTIDIGLRLIDFFNEVRLGVILLGLSDGERIALVRTLSTPGNVMPVAESVDHQDIDRTGHASKIGPGGREHMPGIHVQETCEEVDAISRNQSDQDDTGPGRTEERLEEVANTLVHREIKCTSSEGVLDKVERQNNDVTLKDTEVDE